MMDMSTVKNIAIVALLLGSTYLAYVNRNQLLRFLRPRQEKKSKRKEKETANAMTEVCQAFLLYADNFQGIFEPLYRSSVGVIPLERMRNVLSEWDIRMGTIAQAPIGLKSWWSTITADSKTLSKQKLQERTRFVIQMIQSCGIVRDSQTEIVVTKDTGLYYQHTDGEQLIAGQKMHVESPCWYLNSNPVRIIEKGYCGIM